MHMSAVAALVALAALIIEPVAEGVLELAGHATGCIVVPVFTLGRAVVSLKERGARVRPRWHHIDRAADGRFVVDADMGTLIGIVFWFAVVGVVVPVRQG